MSLPVESVLRPALELYLDLHRSPELSGAEERTAALLADRLARLGYNVLRGVGGHGVVGVLRTGPGPTVLLRAELDALPVAERTGLPYASTAVAADPGTGREVPVMHACGHDAHLACLVGAAELLAVDRSWRGTVLVVGQPAEETLTGARAMLADGLYERVPVPGVVLAQHTAPLPAGMVAHGTGPVLAGSVAVEVVLPGVGGHAAVAHLAVNPIAVAARVVLGLDALGPDVAVTVGAVHAGERGNVVPDSATLRLSLRSFADAALDRALTTLHTLVTTETTAAFTAASRPGGEVRVTVTGRAPVTVCDAAAGDPVRAAHVAAFGPARVTGWPPSLATEDVGLLAAAGADLHGHPEIRLAHWMLGSTGRRRWAAGPAGVPVNHSPFYAPDPRPTLTTGIEALHLAARTHLA